MILIELLFTFIFFLFRLKVVITKNTEYTGASKMKRTAIMITLMIFVGLSTNAKEEQQLLTGVASDSQLELNIPMENIIVPMTDAEKIASLEKQLEEARDTLNHYNKVKCSFFLGAVGIVSSMLFLYLKSAGNALADQACEALQAQGGICMASPCDPNLLLNPTTLDIPIFSKSWDIWFDRRTFPLQSDCDADNIETIAYYVCTGIMAVAIMGFFWNRLTVPSKKRE